MMDRTDPGLLAVARGDEPADLVLAGGQVINVFERTIDIADVAIHGGRIAGVGRYAEANDVVDLHGSFVAPGFIDAHMHVESTMMIPSRFAPVAIAHGTTAVVLDPHEIANVAGIAGIRYLMDDSVGAPMTMCFMASSCVPASPLENAGAVLGADDLAPLFDDDRVIGLAEMMNFPGVVHAVPEVLEKVALGLRHGMVDGHAPGLSGPQLQAYAAAGIASDHECTTVEEAREKLRAGMFIYLREGSAAKNLAALLPLITPATAHRCCFCTDDRHPHDLLTEGHIDHVVRLAIRLGLDLPTAIAMATLHPARIYGLNDLGAVAPGRAADLIVFDDGSAPAPRLVLHRGEVVARDGAYTGPMNLGLPAAAAEPFRGSVHVPGDLDERVLALPRTTDGPIRVIGVVPHQIVTTTHEETPLVVDGCCVSDSSRDLLKIAVIERHHATGNVGAGFVRGFGLQRGALASTVGHDAHNLTVVGTNDEDMLTCVQALAACGGGLCVAAGGSVIELLPLPIAGLVSDAPAGELGPLQARLDEAARSIGCVLDDPFMQLAFLPLSVIPTLKVSDLGLIDVTRFECVPLEIGTDRA